ncbi:hypothetical protein P4O66_000815 [Electrophorus voltai]|uniref:WD repeat and FYVE domain containing 2 n=1 Tax=Electrophorus voltai TaxID=2609070 RepID=A0AAD9E039_9TELE|nr:hypothetical protein P4O66_000815 [Electrophorus voltai]
MAAEIRPLAQARTPVLLSEIEAFQDVVNTAVIIPKEDGVISVSQDRTVRVWLKRDSGQYWPSVYHTMPAPCSCMSFNPETRRISVGMDNGVVSEFILSEDYNKMTPARTYQAHQGGVTVVLFVLEMEWVLSTGQDKSFTWHCSESGQQLGTYRTTAWVSGLHERVQGLCYAPHTRQLISCGSDGGIVIWNMDVARQETPEWLDSDSCQKCEQPFFWNFKQMWDTKKIGLRQLWDMTPVVS